MDGKKNDRKENRRVKAKKEAAKAKKQMNRVKKDIATEESNETSSQAPQSKAKINENTNETGEIIKEINENTNETGELIEETEEEKRVPLVAGAPVQGEVEFESVEEAAERREFESLMQYADELHRARKEQESIVC